MYWHLFGARVKVSDVFVIGPGIEDAPVVLDVVAGPVEYDADHVYPPTGRPIREGIPYDTGDGVVNVQYLGTWDHYPDRKERDYALMDITQPEESDVDA